MSWIFITVTDNLCPSSSDLYSIIHYGPLLPTEHADPAEYEGVGGHFLERPSTVDDICDFVVEYLNSDVLVRGLNTHLAWCRGLHSRCRVCCQTDISS